MRKLLGKWGGAIGWPLPYAATLLLLISATFCHAQDCESPHIDSVSPITPLVAGNSNDITITGSCFVDIWQVSVFNQASGMYVEATNIKVVNQAEITATITLPACEPTGSGGLWVENNYEQAGGYPVQIVGSPAPSITSMKPSTWFAGKTYDKVIIRGTGFITADKATADCPATPVNITTPDGSEVMVSGVTVDSKTKITLSSVSPAASAPTETATVTVGTAPNTGTATAQILSDTCQTALSTANKDEAAITRAMNAWSVLQAAAEAHDIDTALLAAIGVRETGFENVQEKLPNGKNGPGMGVFQLTNQPGVTKAQAFDLTFAANYAANMLSNNENILSNEFPAFTPDQLMQATAASYNIGTDPNTGISGNPNTIDVGTAPGGIRGNYGSNVVGLMSCFQQP